MNKNIDLLSAYADVLFYNGSILTVSDNYENPESLIVKGNKIAFIGSYEDSKKYINEKTKVIDLKGRTLMPGFIDSHTHFAQYGMFGAGVFNNIFYSRAKSIEEILNIVKDVASKKNPGEWIIFWGYDQTKVKEKRHPLRKELDEAAPNNPILVSRLCGHIAVYNTLGMKKSGVYDNPNIPDNEAEKIDGEYTGLVRGNAHKMAWDNIIINDDDILSGLISANDSFIRMGITSVGNQGLFAGQETKMFQAGIKTGKLKIRTDLHLYSTYSRNKQEKLIYDYINTGIHSGFGNEKLKVGCFKLILDGSSSGPSCYLSEPYCHDPNHKGTLNYSQEKINEIMLAAHLAGAQITAHAVGDVAVEQMINAIEYVLSVKPKPDHRYRIEHCALINPRIADRIKELGIIPVPNPGFFLAHTEKYNRYYGERVKYMFPLRAFLEHGIISPLGSDFPGVDDPNPLKTLYGAVNRKALDFDGDCGKEQCVTVKEAIKMHTYDCAYATFEEDIKGSLEPGKLADIIILSEDILACSPDKIHTLSVDLTMIDGEIVYEKV